MDLATIDRNLARLREMVGAMSTNLVALETDTGRTRLAQAPLTGTTAARWTAACGDLACLWQWFAQLNELLDKATQIRGTRSRLEPAQVTLLDGLVNGPAIELSRSDVPLDQRGLFGPAETTIRCSPTELLERMRVAFDKVVEVVGACSQKWAYSEAKLGPLGEQLAEAERLADSVGEKHRPELVQVRSELERLRQSVMCDPLAMANGSESGLSAMLASVTDDLRRSVQIRDNLGAQVEEAYRLMAQLRSTTAAASDARAEALDKIAHPSLVDPRPVAATVERDLERLAAMSSQGDWRAAGNFLVQWTTRYRDALSEAERALAANRAPMAARDELRGRLDAYRGKAYRLGRLEDPVLAALYARAKSALFTAPTDVVEADRLVRQYQQALTGQAPREVST
jgi:hypothetical protein